MIALLGVQISGVIVEIDEATGCVVDRAPFHTEMESSFGTAFQKLQGCAVFYEECRAAGVILKDGKQPMPAPPSQPAGLEPAPPDLLLSQTENQTV